MRSGNKFCCDHPDCKSSCELANPDDLRNVKKALSQRGWSAEEEDKHFCPAHAPESKQED